MKLEVGCLLPQGEWTLSWNPGLLEEKRIRFSEAGKTGVDVLLIYDRVIVSLQYDFQEKPLTLMAEVSSPEDRLELSVGELEIRLSVNGKTVDREWPYGRLTGRECVLCEMAGELTPGIQPEPALPDVVSEFTGIRGWKPEGYNCFAGDCMPFVDGDTFHLFYLTDRRGHHSKWTFGGHKWAHLSTKDLIHWKEHPDVVSIREPREGSICTGSVLKIADGKYRAYFSVRMADRSPARVTWADSDDCIHFTRSDEYFFIGDPYEPVTARDPLAYYDAEEGLYHLLITTSIKREDGFHGVISDFVSPDLKQWEDRPVLCEFDSTTRNQPACPDLFEKDGLWYLLYRDPLRVNRYFYAESKRGPWIAPPDNYVISSEYIVPKSAVFRGKIIFAAFRKDDPGRYYGGRIHLFEAIPDGTGKLTFKEIVEPEIQ